MAIVHRCSSGIHGSPLLLHRSLSDQAFAGHQRGFGFSGGLQSHARPLLRPAQRQSHTLHVTAAAPGTTPPGGRPSLAETHPELLQEWHPTKNGDRTPDSVTVGSHHKVWWLCAQSCEFCGAAHEWEATVSNRAKASRSSGCPLCTGYKVCPCQSVAVKRPDLLAQWDHIANSGLDPTLLGQGSSKRVSWICAKHGSWITRILHRCLGGTGCPKCANERRGRRRERRGLLRDEHPELVAQLHPTKNAHIDLDTVTSGSQKMAVWVCHDRRNAAPGCTHPHEWTATIGSRTRKRPTACPFCCGFVVCPCNSLAVKAPEVAAEWHPTRNGSRRPDQVAVCSTAMVWWRHVSSLTGDVHEWGARVQNRVTIWQLDARLSCRACRTEEKLQSRGRLISRA